MAKTIEQENFTNNLRIYYIELYKKGEVGNMAEFADLCGIPHNSMNRYLIKGDYPKELNRIRQIEICLGKDEDDMMVVRQTVDFHPEEMSWGQPKTMGRPKKRHTEVATVMFLAEEPCDTINDIASLDKEELNVLLHEMRQELRNNVAKTILKSCPQLYKLAYGY